MIGRISWNLQKFNSLASMSSKAKKSQKKGSSCDQEAQNTSQQSCPVTTDKNGCICIRVNAKPGAKHSQITDIGEDGVGIQISAPPVEGQANTELLKYLADILPVRKSDVSLDRGSKSRQKVVILAKGSTSVEEVLRILGKEAESR
ncbi:UPF0235 protein C15orf40 homolog [Phlebotomus argentipes]|uniref:UPF0235 protein C15orf40 homolog n=1 Tax=Phlebotomus argentipes TaxID=94469 RepID=UPI002892C4D0|nr:UPF0235 protein C15orf40 homolog [Phlebotomus argentipes]